MFGSTSPFGQTSFGAQQGFCQPTTATNNPFAPKPFGSPTTTFGAQTGSTLFGAFGQQQSTPAFGSSTPAFGASPPPAFGAASSTFGSGSLFGQKPSFGGFGSSPSQSSPFGGTFQQTEPTFGSSTLGTTANPAFGTTTTPAFGATNAPAFGSTSSSLFGASSTPAFGSTAFGSSPFELVTTTLGVSSTPGFGSSSTPLFGTTSAFSVGSSPSFGQTAVSSGLHTAPSFVRGQFGKQAGGTRIKPYAQTPDDDDSTTRSTQPAGKLDSISAMPRYKDKSHEELRWEDYQCGDKGGPNPTGTPAATPSFQSPQPNLFNSSQITPNPNSFVSNPFASNPSATGFDTSMSPFNISFNTTSAVSSSPFTSSTSTMFVKGQFGNQAGGTRIKPYAQTPDADKSHEQLDSISAMPHYKDKSHEELRWEDYQCGDKGGPNPAGTPAATPSFQSPQPNLFNSSQITPNPNSFVSNPFASNPSATGFDTSMSPFNISFNTTSAASSSPFTSSTSTMFGQGQFGNQAGGTRIKPYAQTPDADKSHEQLDSISAMPQYEDKSHEELRWEDFQRGDKGGSNPAGTPAATPSLQSPQSNLFNSSQITPNPNSFVSNPFASNPSATGLDTSMSPFNTSVNTTSAASSSPFTSSTSTAMFGQRGISAFPASTTPSLFADTTSAFATSSLFGSSTANNSSPFGTGLSLSNTQSAPLFQSIKALQPSSTPAFSGSLFSTPSSGSLFGSRPSPFSTPSAPAQTSNMFSFQYPIQPASTGGFPGFSSNTNQALVAQQTPSLSSMVMQPAPVSNPFGTLPAMPQMSIGNSGSSPSVQYGISSLPVALKPLPSRTLSMVVPSHLSQKRINLLPRKYNPISDGKVPFFADEEESPAIPEADAFFIPRENPRNLIIRPIYQCPLRNGTDRQSVPKDSADLERYKDASAESERSKVTMAPNSRPSLVENGSHHEPKAVTQEGSGSVTSVERLMPKLPQGDYFTEPSVEELVAKERAEPGYCCRVRDFVVGRHGYGSIKFLGEADVRGLDLQSIVEFNIREVIVYKDHSKKPAVGEGLNKAAEVTLLNVKCMNKKTGEQYHGGPRVDRYREMLVKKAEEQGAEFVSFNVAKGEWKFRVKHFST